MKKTPSPLPEDYIQREFETYRKAFAVGNEWGLADAMTLCKEYPSVPLPSWAVDVLRERHADAYHGAYKRSAKWKKQYQQDTELRHLEDSRIAQPVIFLEESRFLPAAPVVY